MAEEKQYAKGFRFDPFDEELISDYLKPMILGKPLPCEFIKFRQVYGPSSNPWHVFPADDQSWFLSPHLKETEKCMYVFSSLSKISKKMGSKKAGSVTSENTSKKAGCGTWDGKTSRKQIRDGEGNVIGDMRYLAFEINEIDWGVIGFDWSKVGLFKMHEYRLSGVNASLDSADSIVLCKITHDFSKPCKINLKSGNKISSEKEEIVNKNAVLTRGAIAENLAATPGGVDNVSEFKELDTFSQEKEETIRNLEDPSSLTTDNLLAIPGGFDDLSALDAFCRDFDFDDLGSESLCLGDLGDVVPSFDDAGDLGDVDADWIISCLESDQQEGHNFNNFGKRKFEAEEDSCTYKKTCLFNDY